MGKPNFRAISLSAIQPPPEPLRGAIDPERLAELAASLTTHGQLQPILVRQDGPIYVIIAGHRRCLAAQALGWDTIEAKVLPAGVKDEAILSLVENMQREDLTPVEEARVIYNFVQDYGLDVDVVASRFGKTRSWVEGRLALTSYPEDILSAIQRKAITLGVARELARVHNDGYRQWLIQNAEDNGATVKTARLWADDWQRSTGQAGQELTAEPGPRTPYEGQGTGLQCAGCDVLFPIAQLRPLYCCPSCIKDHFAMKEQARTAAEKPGGTL